MVLIEKVCYKLGEVIVDVALFSVTPAGLYSTYKVASKFSMFAAEHSLKNKTVDIISENLFECLPFLE